ncbi:MULTISPECIES: hypothetical protein [Oceanobacillus]|uniref:Uncharacterized protein n=1 Tax=Oceanobacillus kimchii TaxID=746691 RepID=A0ABQ5TPC8_9BACI|nr:hypothetical protein [Oceanobacillus kimchii]GLO68375.1 hypothetical protein MACH08_41590 [Oceanobacillus kimchii]
MKHKKNISNIYRIDDSGFYCKPYTSRVYSHVFEFIDIEILDLYTVNQSIPETCLHLPAYNDIKWSGCFCFLDEYNKKITSKNGALAMRNGEKINLALIPINTTIWVRNCSHLGKDNPFYNKFTYNLTHEGKVYTYWNQNQFDSFRWVRMSVNLALERTRLWKENNKNNPLPEWLTEFYLMESQLHKLIPPSFDKRVNLYVNNLLRKIVE